MQADDRRTADDGKTTSVSSLVTMQPTKDQLERIAYLKREFGRAVVKEHAPDPSTGVVRVTLQCAAGTWEWFFDWNGIYIEGHLTQRLFDLPDPPRNPRNAIDN